MSCGHSRRPEAGTGGRIGQPSPTTGQAVTIQKKKCVCASPHAPASPVTPTPPQRKMSTCRAHTTASVMLGPAEQGQLAHDSHRRLRGQWDGDYHGPTAGLRTGGPVGTATAVDAMGRPPGFKGILNCGGNHLEWRRVGKVMPLIHLHPPLCRTEPVGQIAGKGNAAHFTF
jgi:hypothetical protein